MVLLFSARLQRVRRHRRQQLRVVGRVTDDSRTSRRRQRPDVRIEKPVFVGDSGGQNRHQRDKDRAGVVGKECGDEDCGIVLVDTVRGQERTGTGLRGYFRTGISVSTIQWP